MKEESPAVRLYKLAMREQGYQMGRCRLRVDHCRQSAVSLCIRYGIQFFVDDFIENDMPVGEGFYAVACGKEREHHNKSAVLAMEKKWGRKPFILREPGNKTGTRVYVGRSFQWLENLRVECRSFNDAKGYFNAIVYEGWVDGMDRYSNTVVRRFRITHDDIRAYHKYLNAKAEFHELLGTVRGKKKLDRIRDYISKNQPTKKQSSDWSLMVDFVERHTEFVAAIKKGGEA